MKSASMALSGTPLIAATIIRNVRLAGDSGPQILSGIPASILASSVPLTVDSSEMDG